jgi:pimeloyl-ACP methyl ester carboxylesterase
MSVRQPRAVVIVSGLASTSPFTTPQNACDTGLAAGSADTAIRDHLLSKGRTVYTAPMMAGRGQVAGEHLARFIYYLHTDKGVDEVDLVGHSMGGLYAHSAIRALATTDSPVKVRSLVTVGTPWQGSYLADRGSIERDCPDGVPRVLDAVNAAIENAPTALGGPNREGCPA